MESSFPGKPGQMSFGKSCRISRKFFDQPSARQIAYGRIIRVFRVLQSLHPPELMGEVRRERRVPSMKGVQGRLPLALEVFGYENAPPPPLRAGTKLLQNSHFDANTAGITAEIAL